MRCPNCRVVVPDETTVCPKCRARLRGAFDAPPAPSQPARPRPARRPTERPPRAIRSTASRSTASRSTASRSTAAHDYALEVDRAFGDAPPSAAGVEPPDETQARELDRARQELDRRGRRLVEQAEAEARRNVERAETDAANARI